MYELFDWDLLPKKEIFVQYTREYAENFYRRVTRTIPDKGASKEEIYEMLKSIRNQIMPRKQIYAKDGYLLLLNLVMHDKQEWEKIVKQSKSSLEWDSSIAEKFRGFESEKGWNRLKKREKGFLDRLFYGANLDSVNVAKAKNYLTYIVYDFFFFLAENLYHSLAEEKFEKLPVLFDKIYKPLPIDIKWFAELEKTLRHLLDENESDYIRGKIKKWNLESNSKNFEFYQAMLVLKQKLQEIFDEEIDLNQYNIFTTSEKTELTEKKIIIGVGTMGSIYAINKVIKSGEKKEKLYLFGGVNALWDSYAGCKTRLWEKLEERGIDFVCYFMDEEHVPIGNKFVCLKKSLIMPLVNYCDQKYSCVLYQMLMGDFEF